MPDYSALFALHRRVRAYADDMTNSVASETRDMDAYLLAMMHLQLDRVVPCDLAVLTSLRTIAATEGYA